MIAARGHGASWKTLAAAVSIVKTRASHADAVGQTVKELHSYTTPAIAVMPLESVEENYFRWIVEETAPQ